MPRRRRGTKPKKWTLRKQLVLFLGVPFLLCFVLFIAMDSLTTYWFVLFNNDDDIEARRREDFSWYDNYGQQTPNNPGSAAAPGYVDKNVGTNDPAEVLKIVSNGLSDEERSKHDTMYRFFIYLMDSKGFARNATIGAMSYMMGEGGSYTYGMGTYTYENLYHANGPSGVIEDKTLDNDAWLAWLDGAGKTRAIIQYQYTYAAGNSAWAAIGLGLTQESDVWKTPTSGKTTANATALINAAKSAGTYWQDPAFQIPYFVERKFLNDDGTWKLSAWDVNDNPGADPTDKNDTTTATMWACRVWCGVGMPGNNSATAPSRDPDGYTNHTKGVDKATELYDAYSGKDPWFYNPDGSQIYAQNPGNNFGVGGYVWGNDPCPACNQVKADDWHCPFCGPVYDNSTPQGLLVARVALLNAIDKRTSGSWVFPSGGALDFTTTALNDSRVNNYRITIRNFGRTTYHAADCCSGVQAMVRLSGVDTAMPKVGTLKMEAYLWDKGESVYYDSSGWSSNPKNDGVWEYIGVAKEVQLQPGDILIMNSDYPYAGGTGHIQIYVGENVASERWAGTTARIAQASQEQYYWDMCNGYDNSYRVFRCTSICPYDNLTNWNTFKSSYRSTFSVDYPG